MALRYRGLQKHHISAGATIALGATAKNASNALSWTHVVGASDTMLIVWFGYNGDNVTNNTTVTVTATYGGVAMTSLGHVLPHGGTDEGFGQMFYLKNPTPGSASVVMTPSNTTTGGYEGTSASFSGVSNISAAVTGTGNGNSLTGTVSSASGQWAVMGAVAGSGFGSVTSPAVQAIVDNAGTSSGAGNIVIDYKVSTSASTAIVQALTTDDWAYMIVNLS